VSPTTHGGARRIAAYFQSTVAGGSAHYVIDPGEVIQTAWDSVICHHAPPNQHSLGVEFCDWVGGGPNRSRPLPLQRWTDEPHLRMLKLGARLVAELCLAYQVPVRMVGPLGLKAGRKGICEHSDVSEAFRQSSHWDLGEFPRRRFIRMVKAEVDAIKGKDQEPVVARSPSLVSQARELLEQAYRNARRPIRRTRIKRALAAAPRR
jgi:hypothetical protein